MPDSPTSEPEFNFRCDCYDGMRSACAGEPFYKEHEGKRYCVLHFPDKDKSADFEVALQRKLDNKDFDFRGVWFPDEVSFDRFNFSAKADFFAATFSRVAYFSSVTFNAAVNFGYATFSAFAFFRFATFNAKAHFNFATFSAATDFSYATFSETVDFDAATFSAEAFFISTTFRGDVYFTSVTFRDHVRFSGNERVKVFSADFFLNLQFSRTQKSDQLSFHTLTLHPHWFVNVDARKFDFINVHWSNYGNVKAELKLLKSNRVASPHRLLAIACRKLAANAEENNRYREASEFRRMALDTERLETWRGFDFRRLNWWYWLASGYGERPFQALLVLVGILLIFAALYTQVGFAQWEPKLATEADVATAKKDEVGAPLPFRRALTYSAGVLTFQRPEPKPATTTAQAVVLLETILGPVQAALLALAIRRKFMR